MPDKDLRDDMLKLVRYKILFVKRDYEHAFPEKEELVSENTDSAGYTAWKIAEFIQKTRRNTEIPGKWRIKSIRVMSKKQAHPKPPEDINDIARGRQEIPASLLRGAGALYEGAVQIRRAADRGS